MNYNFRAIIILMFVFFILINKNNIINNINKTSKTKDRVVPTIQEEPLIDKDALDLTKLYEDETKESEKIIKDIIFQKDSTSLFYNGYKAFFADNDNVLYIANYTAFKNEKGENDVIGGIYNINLNTKKVTLFDSLPIERAKEEKLYVCTDGLRVLTNHYYKPPNGEYIHVSDPRHPWPDYNKNKYQYKYFHYSLLDQGFTSTFMENCIIHSRPEIVKNPYKEYKGSLQDFNNGVFTARKLNNSEDLYIGQKVFIENEKKYIMYYIFDNDKILYKTRKAIKYSLWDNKIYTIKQMISEENGVCYKIEELDDNFKKVEKNKLLCPLEHLNKRSRGTKFIQKVNNGYVIYHKSSFPKGHNLALFDNDLNFKKYLIKSPYANSMEVQNVRISPDGCGIIYRPIPVIRSKNEPFVRIIYKNICKENKE